MICAISGEAPEDPVVSKKSGLLYERRLVERHIADYGKCPVTGEPLSMDDIVAVKTNKAVKPRPLQAASIPGLLGMFQNEWDALMLSNFALEQQLHTARQELSHALYQHDAACRVIARIKKERDEARELLAQADRQIPISTAAVANSLVVSNGKRAAEDEEMGPGGKRPRPGVSDAIIDELTACNTALSAQRKKRQIPESLMAVDDLRRFTQISSHPLHKTSKPGILSIDIHPSKDIIATGGVDSNAVIFDRAAGQILSTLTGHSKKVTCVKFVPRDEIFISSSADKTVRLWQGSTEGSYTMRHVLKDHTAEVQAVSVHATHKYFVTASLDNTWCFYDLASALCLSQVSVDEDSANKGYTSAAFHPDGLILGTGTEGLVRIWDVKSQQNVANFDQIEGSVTSISFSENGYFLATVAHDGVKLWDLRKLKIFRHFSKDEDVQTYAAEFDHSGNYLATVGSDLRVYQTGSVRQDWNLIKRFEDLSGTGKVTSVKFGPDANFMAVGSMDRNLRIYGLPLPGSMLED
ncbi:hypothetical protein H6P81_011876 [Aristolochia fimbriata]|uniref:Pre-mRNA-processing factor 19 n=1 Tax=Aristolochia fimbriata TaxID=158543 RepID=A0AAV7EAC9_ARIFI|nr:hypothetical protein H6P81_011876 [Aristolochia fimbriata]